MSKILSAGYRVPLQNLTGDLGFYIYQQVYPLLGMMIILALYGFPSAISTLVAEQKDQHSRLSLLSFYIPVFVILLGISGGLAALIWMSAPWITSFISDGTLESAYRIVAMACLFIPAIAVLRGSFQGLYVMHPVAYSQIGEQLFRVFIIIYVAYAVSEGRFSTEAIGEAGAYAAIIGAVVAFVILFIYFIRIKPFTLRTYDIPWKKYLVTIVSLGIVASLNHMILLVLQLADVFTLVPSLLKGGFAPLTAMEQKGIFDRGQPLIQVGTVIGSSFALAFIPATSLIKVVEESSNTYRHIRHAFSFSFYLAAGATIGLFVIFPEVNTLLYKNTLGTDSLRILSIAILLSSLCITATSILQGLNDYKWSALFIVLAFIIKLFGNMLLVPFLGITGSAIATVISLLVLAIAVMKQLNVRLRAIKLFSSIKSRAVIGAASGMIVYLTIIRLLIPFNVMNRLQLLIYVLFLASSGAAIYFILLLRLRAFSDEQLSTLPFGHQLMKWNKGRDNNGE